VLVVLRTQLHREVVGDHSPSADVDGSAVVHLTDEAPADLDGSQSTPESTGEHAFDHALETPLEPRQTHGATLYAGRCRDRLVTHVSVATSSPPVADAVTVASTISL
jgi:hypothetical protein